MRSCLGWPRRHRGGFQARAAWGRQGEARGAARPGEGRRGPGAEPARVLGRARGGGSPGGGSGSRGATGSTRPRGAEEGGARRAGAAVPGKGWGPRPPPAGLLPALRRCPVITASPVSGCSQVVLFASSLRGRTHGPSQAGAAPAAPSARPSRPPRPLSPAPLPSSPAPRSLDEEDAAALADPVTPAAGQRPQPLHAQLRRGRHGRAAATSAAGEKPRGAGRERGGGGAFTSERVPAAANTLGRGRAQREGEGAQRRAPPRPSPPLQGPPLPPRGRARRPGCLPAGARSPPPPRPLGRGGGGRRVPVGGGAAGDPRFGTKSRGALP